MLHKFFSILILSTLLVSGNSYAQEQCDFDGDGISDFTYLSTSGTTLTWNSVLSATPSTTQTTSFGITSDQVTIAHWLDQSKPNLGIVRLNSKKNAIVWKIYEDDGGLLEESLGKPENVYLSGADFDGNGIADAAVVQNSKSGLKWTVRLNMFSDSGKKTLKFTFGKTDDRVLFLNPEGEKDWAGVFGKGKGGRAYLTLRNLSTKKKKIIKGINKKYVSGTRPRPFPVSNSEGVDSIGIFTSDDGVDSNLLIYDLEGKQTAKKTFSGLGTIVVGNYDNADPGEEIAFQTSGSLSIYNPFSGAQAKATPLGTIIDEINIETVHAPTPIATAIPSNTPTVAATATATPG